MVTKRRHPTRNSVLGRKGLDTGFFHPIPVSDLREPVNLGRYEIMYATLSWIELFVYRCTANRSEHAAN